MESDVPFLTWGRSASRSFMRCRMRCVMPREERRSTRCLFFIFFGAGAWISSSSTSMISPAFRFPLPFASALAAFAFCVFRSEAIVCAGDERGRMIGGMHSRHDDRE